MVKKQPSRHYQVEKTRHNGFTLLKKPGILPML